MAKQVSKKSDYSTPVKTTYFVQDDFKEPIPVVPAITTYACWDCRTYYEVEDGMLLLCPNCGSQKARTVN